MHRKTRGNSVESNICSYNSVNIEKPLIASPSTEWGARRTDYTHSRLCLWKYRSFFSYERIQTSAMLKMTQWVRLWQRPRASGIIFLKPNYAVFGPVFFSSNDRNYQIAAVVKARPGSWSLMATLKISTRRKRQDFEKKRLKIKNKIQSYNLLETHHLS